MHSREKCRERCSQKSQNLRAHLKPSCHQKICFLLRRSDLLCRRPTQNLNPSSFSHNLTHSQLPLTTGPQFSFFQIFVFPSLLVSQKTHHCSSQRTQHCTPFKNRRINNHLSPQASQSLPSLNKTFQPLQAFSLLAQNGKNHPQIHWIMG